MAKTAKTTSRGNLFSLTASGRKALDGDGFGIQQKLVAQALSKKDGITSAELTAIVEKGGKLETRQSVSRVVGFYLSQMKAEGLVSAKKAPKAEPKPAKKTAKRSSKKTAQPEQAAA